MKKLCILPAVLCFLVLTACGGLYHNAYVAEVSGTVTLVRDGKESELAASQKGLEHKDAVITAEQSSAWLRLDGGKEIVLADKTEVGLFASGKSCMLELRAGCLLARLDKPLKSAETFDITVGSLAVSARDSTALFSIQWVSDREALLNVYHGRAAIVASRSGGELITLSAGETICFDFIDAELTGEAGPIDDTAIPAVLSEYVLDYLGRAAAETPSATPDLDPQDTPPPEETPVETAAQPMRPGPKPVPTKQPDIPSAPALPTGGGQPEPDPPKDNHTGGVTVPEPESSSVPSEPEVTLPTPPAANLKCLWDSNAEAFGLFLDITWSEVRADHIDWQVCDAQGDEIGEGGTIRAAAGLQTTNYDPGIASPENATLWPQGCVLRLTPYYTAEAQSEHPAALAAIDLELPYLTLTSAQSQGKKVPVIETNIGLWFEHSYPALTVETGKGGLLRITGTLYPLEGEQKPLKIDIPERQ